MEIVPSLLCIDSLGISIGVKDDDGAIDGVAIDGVAIDADCADDSDGKEDGSDANISDDESEASAFDGSVNSVF